MFSRNRITAALAAVTVALAIGACDDSSPSSPSSTDPQLQNNSRQIGLVNVSTGDVALLNNVNIAVAANVIATVCDVTIPVAVIATQVIGTDGATFCAGTADPITITQSTGNQPFTLGGGNNSRQAGLVNVSLGDVAILNNVNAGVAANVLVTACKLTVPVAVLSLQTLVDTGETTCTSAAGPIVIDQA